MSAATVAMAEVGAGKVFGYRVETSEQVPHDKVIHTLTCIFLHPKTWWSYQHGGAWPGLSRYAPGVIALERDRRRKRKR